MTERPNIPTVYDPKQVEKKWYDYWMEKDQFKARGEQGKEPFTIVIPPPNVTGQLHMGHALDNTLQDIIIRQKRMQGYDALWLPGTDHAGIATQVKVEEELMKSEKLSKHDLGREKFVERVWDWKHQYGDRIISQLKALGASCDWSRERFTLDEGCSKAVREVFVRYYEKGLIYRGTYIVNWCPHCSTVLSDIEVEHEDAAGKLYYFRYPLTDGNDYVTIATTRPETMLGDVAVAVNPEDPRYAHLIGKTLMLPIVNREIPIIADSYVDLAFGTGCVKITPAHDPNDFEMGLRHKLEQVVVMNKDGTMNENAGKYQGIDRYECRKALVKEMESLGLVDKIQDHQHAVGQCYRCGTVVEPLVSTQWFVRMEPLAKPAIEAVRSGDVEFVPERFTKTYMNWLENIRDWCISRQLWWGHRIPAWYCPNGHTIVSKDDPTSCPHCGSTELTQESDVLDTWFSSALWPFSTLGWPADTADLKRYFPTSVLVTGYDIIFFWVVRMVFSSLEFMGEVPFKKVLLHGLIRDSQGRKMSKSLNNGIDPVEIIEQFGADTLRFTLVTGNTPGNDMRFHMDRVESSRNFANKIWNASRFVLMNLGDFDLGESHWDGLSLADRWILSRLNGTIGEVNRYMERYEFGEAGRILYDFIWSEFCDWFIELAKPRLYGGDIGEKRTAQTVLAHTLSRTMELLHPFMPFITEEIWQCLPHEGESIMRASWPQVQERFTDPEAERQMGIIMDAIRSIRNIRAEMNVSPGKKAEVIVVATNPEGYLIAQAGHNYLQHLGAASQLTIHEHLEQKPAKAITAVVTGFEIYLPLAGLIDLDKEMERLNKELASLAKEVERIETKLNNPGFVNKAPAQVIEQEKAKLIDYAEKQGKVRARLEELRV